MMYLALYLAVGGVAGVLAGLLGIGGGLIIVPMLTSVFTHQHVAHEVIVHMALGTSLASILFTSVSSMRSHHKRGAVVWPVVFRITPGILVGTFTGTWIASMLSTNFLKCFFGIFLYYVATQMLIGYKTQTYPGYSGYRRDLCGGQHYRRLFKSCGYWRRHPVRTVSDLVQYQDS